MAILPNIAVDLQSMLGVIRAQSIEDLGRTTGLIRRRRKFSACTLLRTLVLTLLKKRQAKLIDYQATAAELGVFVIQAAIDKRFSKELIVFLREVIERTLQPALAITASRAKLLREKRHSGRALFLVSPRGTPRTTSDLNCPPTVHVLRLTAKSYRL